MTTAALRVREPYVVGLDLGQAHDPTALAIVERAPGATVADPVAHLVRHLHRWPLWTPYPQIVGNVHDMLDRPPLKGATAALVVDATGVGRAVVDLFADAALGVRLVPVTITAGNDAHEGFEGWRVPKRDLVGVVQVLLQRRRLRIAKALAEAERLLEEMEAFRVQITATGRDTYGAGPQGVHDDLVLAVALACWWGDLVASPQVEVVDDAPFDAWSPEALQAEWERGHRVKRSKPKDREYPPEAF
ncbi:MAG TPA: hypothetical protein VGA02_15315 [Gemmatimonadales bacterium]